MVYSSFEELNNNYPERFLMSYEQELAYVEDCFDTYENIGFEKTFQTEYDDLSQYNGMKFEVIERLREPEADLETLPLWRIKLENGKVVVCYPEEICTAERMEMGK